MEWQFRINWQAIVEEAKQRRKKQKLTQARLGELAQVSTPTVSRFESGDKDIQLSTILNILGILGMTDSRHLIFPVHDEVYDHRHDVIVFNGMDGDKLVRCAISIEALEDHFGGDRHHPLKAFASNRERILHEARRKYLSSKVETDDSIARVFIKTADIGV